MRLLVRFKPEVLDLEPLLNASFSATHYVHSFPLVFCEGGRSRFFFEYENKQCVSFCSLYPLSFLLQQKLLRAGCVGSVCTDVHFRGAGFGGRVIEQAEAWAQKMGLHFLFLFSSEAKLYKRHGYIECAEDLLFRLPHKGEGNVLARFDKDADNSGFEFCSDVPDAAETRRLWNFIVRYSEPGESCLSYSEFLTLLTIPDMTRCSLKRDGEFYAVCFLGKGLDYVNVAHGFVTRNRDSLLRLLFKMRCFLREREVLVFLGALCRRSEYQDLLVGAVKNKSLMVKSMPRSPFSNDELAALFNESKLYVRSLQSN